MKILTGLLPASAGEAAVFGQHVDTHDMATRKRIGFMSQGFSLYGELTVRQTLHLSLTFDHRVADGVAAALLLDEMIAKWPRLG